MPRYVAFLRAVNAGPGRTLKMERLRRTFEALRFKSVRTIDRTWAVLAPLVLALVIVGCRRSPTPVSPTAPPPEGSVLIEDGKCCIAAVAGEEIDIRASFEAAHATEMRAGAGLHALDEAELAEFRWEPFSMTRVFTYHAPINWTGFFVTAQFRNASGAVSPIYSDDISVEGMPAPYPLSTP